jgi:GDP-L-fucose synthase
VVAIFERVKPTHVIHLGAAVGGLFMNMRRKVNITRAMKKVILYIT